MAHVVTLETYGDFVETTGEQPVKLITVDVNWLEEYLISSKEDNLDRFLLEYTLEDILEIEEKANKDNSLLYAEEFKKVYNPDLTIDLANMLDSECEECHFSNQKQDFTVTDHFLDDGKGVYPIIYCNNCKKNTHSGDGEFHDYYQLIIDTDGGYILGDKSCPMCNRGISKCKCKIFFDI